MVDTHDLEHDMIDILTSGGFIGTRYLHQELFKKGYVKLTRKRLLQLLHTYAEPGGYVSLGGIRQKSWIM